jgi:hypothetical protein
MIQLLLLLSEVTVAIGTVDGVVSPLPRLIVIGRCQRVLVAHDHVKRGVRTSACSPRLWESECTVGVHCQCEAYCTKPYVNG